MLNLDKPELQGISRKARKGRKENLESNLFCFKIKKQAVA